MNRPFYLYTNVILTGGRYVDRPSGTFGVKLAAEINRPHDVSIPTQDYSVPDGTDLHTGVLRTLGALILGRRVFVGCMGGVGRTGLFFAALSKAMGYPEPVGLVRARYFNHAVETHEQQEYIDAYKPWLAERIAAKALKLRVRYLPASETCPV